MNREKFRFAEMQTQITDPSSVKHVVLWYRVGANQAFTPVDIDSLGNGTYAKTVKGTEVPGSKYGVWEFYLAAEDGDFCYSFSARV